MSEGDAALVQGFLREDRDALDGTFAEDIVGGEENAALEDQMIADSTMAEGIAMVEDATDDHHDDGDNMDQEGDDSDHEIIGAASPEAIQDIQDDANITPGGPSAV
jgi:hypothetical protein